MPDWTIHLAGPGDAPDVLAADVFDDPADAAATARFLGTPEAPDPRNILVLARMGGRVVGFASGTVLDHPDKPRNLFVQELGVNEEVLRRGIARALLAALRAEGRMQGCKVTWVLTEHGNLPARVTYAGTDAEETTGVVMYGWDGAEEPRPEGSCGQAEGSRSWTDCSTRKPTERKTNGNGAARPRSG
jgi:GNAT superfamily N-acetyltransferase